MNIIPFVVTLILIFAISTNTLLKKKISEDTISKSASGYMAASRKSLNNFEKYYFESIQEKPKEKSKKENEGNETNENKKRFINIENAKINIYPLVSDKKENQIELYNLAASLIKTLYLGNSFYKPNFEKDLLDNILASFEIQLKKDKECQLSNLTLKDPRLQKNYYKILKGTKFYDYEKKIGIPSLLDFIKYENTTSKIPMKDASFELLLSVFTHTIANEIVLLQIENPPKNLTKQNILDLCQKHSYRLNENFLDFFDFSTSSKNSKEKIFVGFDKSTNIKVKRKLSLN